MLLLSLILPRNEPICRFANKNANAVLIPRR